MKNLWVRFGCFLTGYNYNILRGCSEASFKAVKKYTAAMLIISILWFCIGFTFAQRYLTSNQSASVIAGVIAVIVIVQIERQIILTIRPGKMLRASRIGLAVLMSIIGAVIIDQIIFEKDIELEKISYIQTKVDSILPFKTRELERQIKDLDSTISRKEREKLGYAEEARKNPIITYTTSQTQMVPSTTKYKDRFGNDSIATTFKPFVSLSKTSTPNPKNALALTTDSIISGMRQHKAAKENELLHIRPALELEIKSKTGFLDELKVMAQLIFNSGIALFFWLLWILFFMFIEMLVLVSKQGEKASDYEETVLHHMNLQKQRLNALANAASPA